MLTTLTVSVLDDKSKKVYGMSNTFTAGVPDAMLSEAVTEMLYQIRVKIDTDNFDIEGVEKI